MGRFRKFRKFKKFNGRFNTKDKFNFMIILIEKYGHDFESALSKVDLTLGEMIYAHDKLLPTERQIALLNKGNKKYKYLGNGHFRRVNSNGCPCVDGKSKMVDGAKRIGFIDNPLKYVWEDK